ncbi:hypothetical protein GCK72_003556 [Caenorhabditis remanei]|uniref:Uncharacterized protein n=1 Tax=Caenorhabditis remanei TaxID=31234 RepID=A0A6A5HV76_CAERE|nr:hypothetical protein GCK72_003555 [Caenorhabditis remanei]XP_053592766.1 hypothetical protein GCK72_003556 [Caenorhabditis remanei]KAF1771728.1 hypothetical protein GCK72_003555 [Caenorhabditis remanei]KAF1771729.1 hypothetical protein GCK72_003556 [Caenorhabditis remanei]
MSHHTEKSSTTTPNTTPAPRSTTMSASSSQTSPPPSYEDSKGFTSRPLRVIATPREFLSDARLKEAKETTPTSSSAKRGPLSFLEQIRERCEPLARAFLGTTQLDDHTTVDSSTAADLEEIKNLLQSLIIDRWCQEACYSQTSNMPSARAPKMAKYSLDNCHKAGPSGSAPQ